MKTPPEIIAQLTHSKRGFSKSELKVVDAILLDPESATRASIAQLAQLAGVSEPPSTGSVKNSGPLGSQISKSNSPYPWPQTHASSTVR